MIALKADGTVYAMSEPMVLNYVHAASKDMNENKEIVFVKEDGNDHNPVPALCTCAEPPRDTTRGEPLMLSCVQLSHQTSALRLIS